MGSNLYISASGAMARLRDLDVVANNLANISTTGFKRQQPVFEAVLESAILDAGGQLQPGEPGRSFVSTSAIATDFSNGSFMQTGAPLDVAIEGPGFFEVETQRGLRYTRAGSFIVDTEGMLSLPGGERVMGRGGEIPLGSGAASIEPSGRIVDETGAELGRLKLMNFDHLGMLEKEGNGFFRAPQGAKPEEVEGSQFSPGSLEGSNVESVRELSSMVILKRAFDSNLRALKADDKATSALLQEFSR